MIVFELICGEQHRFEGWFASSEDFSEQQEQGLIECPVCGGGHIQRLPASKIRKPGAAAKSAPSADDKPQQEVSPEELSRVLDYLLTHTEDVGSEFAAEARRIYYQEAPQRSIRGVTTLREAKELDEEGVPVFTLPIPPQDKWN